MAHRALIDGRLTCGQAVGVSESLAHLQVWTPPARPNFVLSFTVRKEGGLDLRWRKALCFHSPLLLLGFCWGFFTNKPDTIGIHHHSSWLIESDNTLITLVQAINHTAGPGNMGDGGSDTWCMFLSYFNLNILFACVQPVDKSLLVCNCFCLEAECGA